MNRSTKRTETHFKNWYAEYKPYLDQLWMQLSEAMDSYIKEPLLYNYSDFVDFVYWNSSGIIN